MKKLVYIAPAIFLIAGSCTSQMYLGSSSDDLYYRPSQAKNAAVVNTGTVQEKKATYTDAFSGDTLIADNFVDDTLYRNDNGVEVVDANNDNVISTPNEDLYFYNDSYYPYYGSSFSFGSPFAFGFYYGYGYGYYSPWYSPYYSWYSPWNDWYSPYYGYYGWGGYYGYNPWGYYGDYYYGGHGHYHDGYGNGLPVARRGSYSSLTGGNYANGNTGLRTSYGRRSPGTTVASNRYSGSNLKMSSGNYTPSRNAAGTVTNPGYERRSTTTTNQNAYRPNYQSSSRSYTPSYSSPRMSSKPSYNNSRSSGSTSVSTSRSSNSGSGSRVQYSSPGRTSGGSITHSSSSSYSGGGGGGSRSSSGSSGVSSSSSSSRSSSGSSSGSSGSSGRRH
jgi:hypothetical protein